MYLLVPVAMIWSIIGNPNLSDNTTIESELLSAKLFNLHLQRHQLSQKLT